MSEYSSHRSSSSKRDKYSSYDDRRSRERRSKDDRDSGYDRGRARSRSRSKSRHRYSGNEGSSSSYRSSHSKRKRSYERDYDNLRYGEHSHHDYSNKYDRDRDRDDRDRDRERERDQRDRGHDRDRDRDRERDRERERERDRDKERDRERDRDRDRETDRRYTSARRSNSRYEREHSLGRDDIKDVSSSMKKSYRSHSRELRERDPRQDSDSRSLAPATSSFDADSLPKAPAAYFQQQQQQQQQHHRASWNYDSSAYSQSSNTAWTGSTDVYSAEAYNQQYASYYGDPNEYYHESYSQQVYHTTEGVPPPPPPPPYPPAQTDKDSMAIPPPPPPSQPMASWSRYSYDGLPTGPAADRISSVALDSQAHIREQTEASHTLGVDNISSNIDLKVLKNIGYPVKASDEPTEKYEKIGQVGEGTYGKVYKAKSKVTGELVALKRIRMESEKEGFPITAMREIKLLQKLRHKRIVQLSEIMVSKGSVYMVLEYMDHDLTGVLGHPEFRFEPAQAKSLIKQMLEGVAFLHHMGVLHRDIKGSNLLLNKKGELKIADFGLARIFQKRRTHDYTNRVITLWYRPPELLLGATAYGPGVDMWSVGCIMLEFFTGKPVFNGSDEISQLEIIYQIMGTPDEKIWPTVVDLPWWELMRPKEPLPSKFRERFASLMSEGALELLEALLALDPSKRPSAAEALQFPYFVAESPDTSSPANLLDIAGDWHEYESKRKRKSGTASTALNGNGDVKKSSVTDKR